MFEDSAYNGRPPCVSGSKTSREAADSMTNAAPTLRKKVFEAILALGSHGATDDELEVSLKMTHQSLSPRRRELVIGGLLAEKGTRKTRSGRKAVVWVVRAARPDETGEELGQESFEFDENT